MSFVKYDVYGIGNALVDFLTLVDDQLLIDRGIKKGIMTLVDAPPHEALFENHQNGITKRSGGSAANTIVGLSVLGGKGCYTGKVGKDELGEFYKHDLNRSGVEFFVSPNDHRTGSCVSLISGDAERSMLTYLGASLSLNKSDLHEDAIAESAFIYVEGYLWDSPSARESAIRAMELAKKHSVKIAFSCSDPWLVGRFREDIAKLMKEYIDLLFCNQREAEEITGFEGASKAALQIAKQVKQLCLTVGGDGAIVGENGRVRATPRLAVEKVLDTTGAGDLYAAGVLRGLTLGFDLVTSSLIGARTAAAIVEKVGARLESKDLQN